ncbi:rho GTPase-activating protein 30 isoform X1 [Canis lupus familiaris]|uniref:Rho GTPase activating protein 30 n=2 Tax=Canis lupus familiaris TaxID=9615 RepID=A0A8C0SM37_CANLF|nr:rho GTPase-activating protein 30 isoform X1 [Canis lupus familiaris]XP_038304559.1 rho GTPase-activating protein 30 isoform X1 [Canis lupus familiaris]XP_038442225.1 rho GTPase-activating protein 30 isoform X1 [Canis lupus familiaris]|eukprot:XP_005640932.1 rho GTPase-activating protein 30 isoform X1 [Canis lupus familiaris]
MKSRQKGKKKGSSKERVFGCDLQEQLQRSGQEVPQVLKSCAEFVEEYGVVDGIYRLSGVSSNIQKLRQEFEAERKPDLRKDVYLQDIHCVSSLCKAYFRELPDPLLTYRLYDKFADAVGVQLEPERLVKILEVLRELPVPNYRTLEFLMRHLVHMASFSAQTNMHARNLAIVWAPNLLRSKDIEASGFNGTAAFMEVRVQSIVVEFILTHVDQLFGGASLSGGEMESGWRSLPGARASSSPEDLMPRSLPYHLPSVLQAGDGPPQIRPYHTIIEIGEHKRKGSLKVRKWRSIFNLGRSGHETKRKLPRGAEDREDKSEKGTLRPAKSMDSLSAAAGVSDEPEGLAGPSSLRPGPLQPDGLEKDPAGAAEGAQEPEAEAPGGPSSEPGTPRAGRSGMRIGGGSRAERCAGVHISDPYNVNLPLHITSILSVPPNIISNVSLARLTRGLECPALQPRPSPASGPGPPDEKLEASSAAGPLADCGPEDVAPVLEDCLSQEVQDSFSFLEDSSGSEPEWVGVEDGEVAKARRAEAAFPGEDDPGMGYLEELLGVGPQVEEFSVEPPLDDLSLDEAQFVLAPSCCSSDSAGPRPDGQEENEEEVFLSAYDDLSPLLSPKRPTWEGPESLEDDTAGCGRQGPPGQAEGGQACCEVGEDKEAEPESTGDLREEAEGSPESEVEDGEVGQEGGKPEGSQERRVSLREEGGEETEAKGEESNGQQEDESVEEAKGVEGTGEQGKDKEMERKTEREEEAEEGEEGQVQARSNPECGAQENPVAEESREAVHKQEAEGGREDEAEGQKGQEDQEAREDQGDADDGRSPEAAAGGGAGAVSMDGESGDGEPERDQRAGGDRLGDSLPEGSHVESLEVDSASEGHSPCSEAEQAAPEPPQPEEAEPEGQPSPDGCSLCPGPLGSASGVGMRLASTLVQVQQVRSVPVVPPKPQFAKMPSAMCSKIHVAPANPCPRPGRLDGTPGERAWGSRASRSSWRNGGSLSFDAAVALARERQRTEAQGIRRTQTCTGGGDYSLTPRTSPCSMIPAYSPRPLSCLELPPEDTEGSGHRSRHSLPPREPQPPDPLLSPQRRSYAFETQANPGRGEGL